MNMKGKNNYFQFKHFRVRQGQAVMKVSTEACILGSYCKHEKPTNILDIGTGTGLLAFMLHQKYPDATITALEIAENAFLQAQTNIAENNFSEKIKLLHQSVQEFATTTNEKFSLIVCNPPFYEKHLLSDNPHKNIALHQQTLSLQELALCIGTLLASEGIAFVLLPPYQMQQFLAFCKIKNLFPSKILEIYHSPKHKLFRYIAAVGFVSTELQIEKLYIKNDDETYTEQFRELLGDFYLAF
jgi:tRNA1Val (adenine37-N6)-methyltransferase